MWVSLLFYSLGGLTLAINKIVQSNFIVGLSLFAYIWREPTLIYIGERNSCTLKVKKKLLYKNQEGCKHLQGIILPKRQACQGHKQTIFLIALLITDTVEPLDALHFPPHRGLVFLRCNINNSHGNVAKPALKIFPLYFFPIHDFLITYSENTREARFFLTSQAIFCIKP